MTSRLTSPLNNTDRIMLKYLVGAVNATGHSPLSTTVNAALQVNLLYQETPSRSL